MAEWQGPGFVDHHVHLLRVAAGVRSTCDYTDPEAVRAYHRSLHTRGLTPMDDDPDPIDVPDLGKALYDGLAEAHDLGLVQVTEAGMREWAYLDALLALRDRGPLPTRVRILVAGGLADPRKMSRTGDPWVEVIGVKLYADGWVGPRTCAVCEPFADRPDDNGILFLDADALCRRIDPLADQGWTVATHAIGDRAMEAVIDAYERIYGRDCPAAAPRIEHAQVLRPHLVDRVAELGIVCCIQPSFGTSDAHTARAALGPERMETAYRWADLLDAGVPVIAGSDYPIESLSPLLGLRRLVTGADVGGSVVAPTVDLERSLAMMTDAAAGTTVLSDDPATVDPEELHEIEVVASVPAG